MDGEVLMPFIELGSGGLEVSLVCKVASAVWYNMVCSLATKLSLQRWHICLGDMRV